MENPNGNHEAANGAHCNSFIGTSLSGGHPLPQSSMGSVMRHNPGLSLDWSAQEQAILEDGLKRYALESSVSRYVKIAMGLPNKTVRDVALRCRWMASKEKSKGMKEEHNSIRKGKERKERMVNQHVKQADFGVQPNVSPFSLPMECDGGIAYEATGSVTGELLEQNEQIFNQIHANLATFKIHANINLLRLTRDNILKVMNDLNNTPETMKRMPPLPEKLNEELANAILDPPSFRCNHEHEPLFPTW